VLIVAFDIAAKCTWGSTQSGKSLFSMIGSWMLAFGYRQCGQSALAAAGFLFYFASPLDVYHACQPVSFLCSYLNRPHCLSVAPVWV